MAVMRLVAVITLLSLAGPVEGRPSRVIGTPKPSLHRLYRFSIRPTRTRAFSPTVVAVVPGKNPPISKVVKHTIPPIGSGHPSPRMTGAFFPGLLSNGVLASECPLIHREPDPV
jgi:hypothetical protein